VSLLLNTCFTDTGIIHWVEIVTSSQFLWFNIEKAIYNVKSSEGKVRKLSYLSQVYYKVAFDVLNSFVFVSLDKEAILCRACSGSSTASKCY